MFKIGSKWMLCINESHVVRSNVKITRATHPCSTSCSAGARPWTIALFFGPYFADTEGFSSPSNSRWLSVHRLVRRSASHFRCRTPSRANYFRLRFGTDCDSWRCCATGCWCAFSNLPTSSVYFFPTSPINTILAMIWQTPIIGTATDFSLSPGIVQLLMLSLVS